MSKVIVGIGPEIGTLPEGEGRGDMSKWKEEAIEMEVPETETWRLLLLPRVISTFPELGFEALKVALMERGPDETDETGTF